VSFAKTRTPPERPARLKWRGLGNPRGSRCYIEGSTWERSTCARQKFLLCNQPHFRAASFACSQAAGSVSGNTARNNLAAVLEDFPIPVAIFAIGHNAEFNTVSHGR